MKTILTILSAIFAFTHYALAQGDKPWHNKDCAVVLTYDDGLNVDLTNAIPALDSVGLKGTFYISDYFDGLKNQIPHWRKAALEGHELANHTIWHPCEGGRKGREFVTAEHDLNNYTVKRMVNEIKSMNNLLYAVDGKTKRTFAYPCGDNKIHDTAYIDSLKHDFIAARGVQPKMLTIDKINLYDIGSYGINGETGADLIALVKQAMEKRALLVFLFHGVGGEHSLNVSVDAHKELLRFLKQYEKYIWVAPMRDVAQYITENQIK